uniref:Uncharacterized protein n=1 Tax=Globodera rostochiensis TaxID=31243 RepID=A0A914H5R8_GLORO
MSEIGKSEIGIPPIPDSHANGRIRHRQLRAVLTWCRLMVDKMTRMAPDLGMPTLWPLFSIEHQQLPATNGQPNGKKKCLAVLQVQRVDKSTTYCPSLRYEFFTTEA